MASSFPDGYWMNALSRLLARRKVGIARPRILVIGVGGAGGNAVNNMIRGDLKGVEFCAVNTDLQALEQSLARHKVQIGPRITRGLGAGARVPIGQVAAEESIEAVKTLLRGADIVFVTAGMGGGTGTGAAPVIAGAAMRAGILTVGVVTKPFAFEGEHRMRLAEGGIAAMRGVTDTLLVIPNQNLFRVADAQTTFIDAFRMADDVLHAGVRGVSDLMVMPGLVNLDFADVRTVMADMGEAMIGTGEAEGDGRAAAAAEAAIANPLIEQGSMKGARGVLINVTGGADVTLFDVNEAVDRIRCEAAPEANIIFGSAFNKKLGGRIRISVVATGIAPSARPEDGEAAEPATILRVPRRAPPAEAAPRRAVGRRYYWAAAGGIAVLGIVGLAGMTLGRGEDRRAAAPATVVASLGDPFPGTTAVPEEDPPPAPDPPPPARAASALTGYRLQIAAVATASAARAELARLRRTQGDLLDRVTGGISRVEADHGPLWRVRIGPIADRGAAEALCEALRQRGAQCLLLAP